MQAQIATAGFGNVVQYEYTLLSEGKLPTSDTIGLLHLCKNLRSGPSFSLLNNGADEFVNSMVQLEGSFFKTREEKYRTDLMTFYGM